VIGLGDKRLCIDNSAMKINESLTKIVRGRAIALVSKEEGLVTIVFDDQSALRIKVAGGPTVNMLGDGKIESVAEDEAELSLLGEDGQIAFLQVAEPGVSVTVTDKNNRVEYAG
jgi:hypothetical protein